MPNASRRPGPHGDDAGRLASMKALYCLTQAPKSVLRAATFAADGLVPRTERANCSRRLVSLIVSLAAASRSVRKSWKFAGAAARGSGAGGWRKHAPRQKTGGV